MDDIFLKQIALKTWNYFSDNSMKTTNYFPPDNVQIIKKNKVAPYTSISNIGFYLLSCYTAYELKFISLTDFVERLQASVDSFTKMERFRGHYYNWYDLKTLKASKPMYVSTVDSGNLAAVFVTLAEGLKILEKEFEFNSEVFDGIRIHLKLIEESTNEFDKFFQEKFDEIKKEISISRNNIGEVVELMHKTTIFITNLLAAAKDQNLIAKKEVSRLFDLHESMLFEYEELYPDPPTHVHEELKNFVEKIYSSKNLIELENNLFEAKKFLEKNPDLDNEYLERVYKSLNFIVDKRKRVLTIADWFESVFRSIDFSFLYNPKLKAVSIGYKSIQKRIEKYHYQTLASESRLSVFLAIAKDDIPREAWDHLNRHTRESKKGPFIVSWSGTMFEYFMPDIFMICSANSIYKQTYLNYLEEQKDYAKKLKIPWGLSESCYYSFNKDKEYKYKAFGIASASLDPNVSEKPVVSAYSTFLAMRHDFKTGIENLKRLIKDGGFGEYGFFEAIDYISGEPKVVRTYMSHHQGMIMSTLCNILKDNKLIKLFHSNLEIKSIEYMLEENKSGPVTIPNIEIQNKDNLIYK